MVKKTILQSIIFNKSKFNNKLEVKKWLKNNNIKPLKEGKQMIDSTPNNYRVRIRCPWRFKKTSFRTKVIKPNIKFVIGKLK